MIQQSRDENIIKKVLGSKIFLFLAVLALIYLVINLGRESYRKHQLTKEVDNLKLEIERLEGSNQQLANLMDYFKEESFIEKEARLKLNLKKPGEKVVILSDYFNTSSNLDALSNGSHNTETTEEESTNYWKWWEYFFQ
ncbi:septum formation initiator family protein [Patescibacteria group bacterium]|nr:septum formation initiator family protein [Patescibacteria group bacterium]MBU4082606.1 septum formation initiator family protein [Patescibacteria group bacterium]